MSKRKGLAVASASLLVLAFVALAATNAIGAPPAASIPIGSASTSPGTNAPFMGSTQGCPSNYWANPDHFSAWEEYTPQQSVGSLFGHAGRYSGLSLADALGNQVQGEDAQRTMLREAVAAALNAANDSLAFPYARYDVGVDSRPPLVPTTNRLFTSGSNAEIVAFTAELAQANDLICPF